MTDHRALVAEHLETAKRAHNNELAQTHVAIAQVHATMAQAEHLRVGNLIAYASLVPNVLTKESELNAVGGCARDSDAEIHSALADGTTWCALLGDDIAKKRGLA